jgi:peptide/nickel transport system substrate-binding protein
LLQLDEYLNVKPCIARTWELGEDGRIYTFYLRNDVYFHDHPSFEGGKGRKVVAGDFIFSLRRITDPEIASPGAWIFNNLDTSRGEAGFTAVSDTVLRVYLKEAFPAFPSLMTMPYCCVVPREVLESLGEDFRKQPVGTGPFLFRYWREDEKLVLLRNPDYFETDSSGRRLPYLDAVNISFIKDKQSEFMEFMIGKLDFLSGLHAVYKDELITRNGNLNPEHANRIKLIGQAYLNTEYLGFQLDPDMEISRESPVLNPDIRRAINFGFDRIKMMKYLRNNIGEAALAGFVPRGMPSFDPGKVNGYRYDPDYSRQLLDRAGYPLGKGLPEITLTTTSDYLDLCEYIQHELYQIGIRLNIEVNTGVAFRERMANGRLEFFRGSWIADYPDAENYLSLFYSRNFSPAGPNYTHYSNPHYDAMFESALSISNDTARYTLYQRLDSMIIADAAVVPLYYDQVLRFVPVALEGLGSNPMNLLNLKRAYWSRPPSEDNL